MRAGIPEWIFPLQWVCPGRKSRSAWRMLPDGCQAHVCQLEKSTMQQGCVQALCQWWHQPVRSKALVTVLMSNYKQSRQRKNQISHTDVTAYAQRALQYFLVWQEYLMCRNVVWIVLICWIKIIFSVPMIRESAFWDMSLRKIDISSSLCGMKIYLVKIKNGLYFGG